MTTKTAATHDAHDSKTDDNPNHEAAPLATLLLDSASFIADFKKQYPNDTKMVTRTEYDGDNSTILIAVVKRNSFELVKFLTQYEFNLNATNIDGETALFFACKNNNVDIMSFLLEKKADPNIISQKDQLVSCMHQAVYHGNIDMIEKLFQYGFDWKKHGNSSNVVQDTLIHVCCTYGHVEVFDYLVKKAAELGIELDPKAKNLFGCTFLTTSLWQAKDAKMFIKVKDTFYSDNKLAVEGLQDTLIRNQTVVHLLVQNGNVSGLKYIRDLVGDKWSVWDRLNVYGISPLAIACRANWIDCVKILLELEVIDPNRCAFGENEPKTQHTILMHALEEGNIELVRVLCANPRTNLTLPANSSVVFSFGSISAFATWLLAALNKDNVTEMGQVKALVLSCKQFYDKSMETFVTTLTQLLDSKIATISLIKEFLGCYSVEFDNTKTDLENRLIELKKNDFICKYLKDHCKKETLEDLGNVINNGLSKLECGFNDTFLFLSKLINNENFNKTMEAVTTECLSNPKDSSDVDIRKRSFFKNNLLFSNVWAKSANGSGYESDEKQGILFKSIETNVIKKELSAQQEFIKKEIESLKTGQLSGSWKDVTHSIHDETLRDINLEMKDLAQNFKFFSNPPKIFSILPTYVKNQLPIDTENEFYGPNEYDQNEYLTELLLTSHKVNPIFQKECKTLMSELLEGVSKDKWKFQSAPVKTRSRCIVKATSDYKDRKWPNTANILDLVRCQVTFDNITDLRACFLKFYYCYLSESLGSIAWLDSDKRCIKGILRVKNGFSKFRSNSNDMALEEFDYSDIKCNVLIEWRSNNERKWIIGEIQFLAKFMLQAKKMGHSIYSFARRNEVYDSISQLMTEDNTQAHCMSLLNQFIITKNLVKLSLYFENMSEMQQKLVVANKGAIESMLNLINWQKGQKLFQSVLKKIS